MSNSITREEFTARMNGIFNTLLDCIYDASEVFEAAEQPIEGLSYSKKDVETMHQANYDLASEVMELQEECRRLTEALRDTDARLETAYQELELLEPLTVAAHAVMSTPEWENFECAMENFEERMTL